MEIIDGIPVWGTEIDQAALKQIKTCYYIFGQAAMMADHHKGYGVPIGGVIAHENLVSPSGVGYDIGCGNKAVLTDADPRDVRRNIATIMDDVWNAISFGVGRKNASPVEHELFDDGNVDESPHCYKRLPEVLGEHQASIKTLHTLRPLGVAMAGAHEFDPYKD
jgi:tRNA-splicing ligase RtcB (3'-phosphate/5'-hydroxy nucleic acid ligase)